jgi:hypothetical protein
VQAAALRRWALVAATAGGVLLLAGAFLPWLRSGDRQRSSFELFAVVDRLGLAPDGAGGVLVRWWPVMPAVVLAGLALMWWQRPRLGAACTLAGSVHATALVAAVGLAPVAAGAGVVVTMAGALVVAPTSVVVAWTERT